MNVEEQEFLSVTTTDTFCKGGSSLEHEWFQLSETIAICVSCKEKKYTNCVFY